MSVYNMNCPPLDCGPCGTLPHGFVRLRYFYGKRLGVADFVDEQRYHSGKMRFHQQRMHGSGVLCGLRAEPFSTDPADAAILRVRRGAAVDACGRDIIVGYDQCIDVDAWLARQLQTQPAGWLDTVVSPDDPLLLPLCIVIRYRECPAQPEPAPRDPCSCDAGGCDFGRIREEFELELIPRPTNPIVPAIFPDRAQLGTAIAGAVSGKALADAIASLATESCPAPDPNGWIDLACFGARLVAPANSSDRHHVTAIEGLVPTESILYQTALLQELLMRSIGSGFETGLLGGDPEITGLAFEETATPTKLLVALSSEVVEQTVPADYFALARFDATASPPWQPVSNVTTTYVATPTPHLEVDLGSAVAIGERYRLVAVGDPRQPIVDANMQPLRPLRFAYHFEVGTGANGNPIVVPITP